MPFQLINTATFGSPVYYLAHPYTRPNPEDNVKDCVECAARLILNGYRVIPPIIFTHYIAESIKKDFEENVEDKSPDFWYEFDEELMRRCDGIIMAGEWRNSKGCLQELWWFKGAGKQVLFYDEETGRAVETEELAHKLF